MSTQRGSESGIRKPNGSGPVTVEQIRALPLYYRGTIPAEYLDTMGHMNVRWYMALYDEATWHLFEALGMTVDYFQTDHAGAFALRHFINYFNEIRAEETVAVHTRLIGRTDKRFHYMHFIVNETSRRVASSIEAMGTHADLKQRRSAPFPPFIAKAIDAHLARDRLLEWDAPVCGILHL